jgi:hypothetical protein
MSRCSKQVCCGYQHNYLKWLGQIYCGYIMVHHGTFSKLSGLECRKDYIGTLLYLKLSKRGCRGNYNNTIFYF